MSLRVSALGLGLARAAVIAGIVALATTAQAAEPGFVAAIDMGPDGNPVLRMAAPDSPAPAPNIRFVDNAGVEHELLQYRGKVTAVHFWATWCVPCRAEMPQVQAMAAALGGADFQVLPISVDRDGIEIVNAFYAEEGITGLPAFLDRGLKAFRAFRLAGVPATIFVDAEGNEIARVLGERDWGTPEALDVIRKLIAGG